MNTCPASSCKCAAKVTLWGTAPWMLDLYTQLTATRRTPKSSHNEQGFIKGDTRSLDHIPHVDILKHGCLHLLLPHYLKSSPSEISELRAIFKSIGICEVNFPSSREMEFERYSFGYFRVAGYFSKL